jgi:flagellar biosynthetic protein FliQ
MTASLALEWLRQMLWTAVVASGPVVLAIAAVGLLIAIVQAATQVNDQAVAFVPKAVVAVVALVVAGPWMMTQMSEFMSSAIIAMGEIHAW